MKHVRNFNQYKNKNLQQKAGSATPLGLAIKGVKMVAFFIALIVALDATLGEKILGGGHGDGHDDHAKPEEDAKPEVKPTTGATSSTPTTGATASAQ